MVRGPFPPQHQGLGGTPSLHPDLWINLVFLPLFTIFGILHFSLFLYNKNKRGVLFPFNAATMGFCATRTIATSLRIAWVYQPRNIHLAMTAQIFVYAGVIILIISNLWWSVRIVRAQHPNVGWSKPMTALIPVPIILSVAMIICLIISVCIMFYLPDPFNQNVARRIQQTGGAMFALWTILPFPILLISTLAKTHPSLRRSFTDNFGDVKAGLNIPNTTTTKLAVCTITGLLLASGACFRAVTNFLGPIPVQASTPWYLSKLCFYVFNFTIEFTVVAFWLIIRVDKTFHTPNGAKGPRSYGGQWQHPGDDGRQTTRELYASRTNLFQPHVHDEIRDSVTTIPPTGLSRTSSWGDDVRSFMAPEHFLTLKDDLEKLISSTTHHSREISWGGHSNTIVNGSEAGGGGDAIKSSDNLSLLPPPPRIRSAGPSSSGRATPVSGRATPVQELGNLVPQMGFDPVSGKWVKRDVEPEQPEEWPLGRLRPTSSKTFVTAEERSSVIKE